MTLFFPPASKISGVLAASDTYPVAASLVLVALYIWRRKDDNDKDK